MQLRAAQTQDVSGGPDTTLTYDGLPAASVIHLRYAVDPAGPGAGSDRCGPRPRPAGSVPRSRVRWPTKRAKRLGANPPAALVNLAANASNEVHAACGVNPADFTAAQGTAGREAYRQVPHALIAPLGLLVASELTDKLAGPVAFDWAELRAVDIASRARAFQSMVGAGMDAAKAAAIAGLMVAVA